MKALGCFNNESPSLNIMMSCHIWKTLTLFRKSSGRPNSISSSPVRWSMIWLMMIWGMLSRMSKPSSASMISCLMVDWVRCSMDAAVVSPCWHSGPSRRASKLAPSVVSGVVFSCDWVNLKR